MQLAAEYWSIDIGYKETKHDEWGYMGKIKFKRRNKIQSTLARYPTIERNNAHSERKTGQAN